MFRPITAAADLPPVGTSREHVLCDFKKEPAGTRFEMAKDVAAFANAAGGTVLIGAVEARGVLSQYLPLDPVRVTDAKRAYEEAIRDRCRPGPLASVEAIPHGDGELVAVNVWPMPATIVAVRCKGDSADGFAGECWMFPLRVASQTVLVEPEQVPMFMLPKVRAAVSLLSQLKKDEQVMVQFISPRASGLKAEFADFVAVEALSNVVTVRMYDEPIGIPLDAVQSVWRDGVGVVVCVRGTITKETGRRAFGTGPQRWVFVRD